MKKITLFIILLIGVQSWAQKDYLSYALKAHKGQKKIQVSDSKNGIKFFVYLNSLETLWDNIAIVVNHNKNKDFRKLLTKGLFKYKEWDSIANANNIEKLDKKVEFKDITVTGAFYAGDWHFDYSTSLKLVYIRLQGKGYLVLANEDKLISSSNQFINHKGFNTIFSNELEIKKFINDLDYKKALKFLDEKKKKESLFKN